MSAYTIQIAITPDGVNQINDMGNFVTVVKGVQSYPANGQPLIAWIAMRAASTITITWEEEYYFYASPLPVEPGVTIKDFVLSTPAQQGLLYAYSNGSFDSGTDGTDGTFSAINNSNVNMTLGLAQAFDIGQGPVITPICGQIAGYEQTTPFSPEITLWVFLQDYGSNGVGISEIDGNAFNFELNPTENSVNLGFDPKTNSFYPQQQQ